MKCKVRIGERILNENSGNFDYLDTENIIELQDSEIINIDIESENILKNGERNVSGAKEEKKFLVKIKGRVIPNINADANIEMITSRNKELGKVPKNEEGYEVMGKDINENLKFEDLVGESNLGLAISNKNNKWQKISTEHSLEVCNRLKEWTLKYKDRVEGMEEEKFDEYRDVKIEIVLSDVQSLYYEFRNMYVDEYKESFDIKSGEGMFNLVLKQKYTEKKENIKINYLKEYSFYDKVTHGFKKLLENIF